MSNIVIVGSISMDLVMQTNRIPQEGESIFGESFKMTPGGKGANQAVAVGRLSDSADTISMLGAVGQDSFGRELVQNLSANHIFTDRVGTIPQSTGVAQITLYQKDNRIIYCPGANGQVDAERWQKEWGIIDQADLVILQNEIPHASNLAIAKYCHNKGIRVLYNPAPARETDQEMIDWVDFITPNEHECQELFSQLTLDEALKAYPNKLIVTLGVRGATYYDGQEIKLIPAIKAEVVDTTGAGDTFNGAFGFAISKKMGISDSLAFATLASHLSVQKFGAQGGMPTLDEMKRSDYYEKNWHFE